MTTATEPAVHAPLAADPRIAFLAAIAVVSRGRALAPAALAAFADAMAAAGVPANVRDEVLVAGRRGYRAAEVPTDLALDTEGAIALLVSLTLFALRAADEPDEALIVSEALAAQRRWPADVIPRLVGRLGPLAADARIDDLAAHLAAYIHPGEAEADTTTWLIATLDPPRLAKRAFGHVSAQRFQHPSDRAAMELASGIAGFDDLTRIIFEHGFEKAFRLINLSSAIRVGPDQFPELYRIWQDCVARAGVDPSIELYVKPGGINAHTSGIERPYVMLDSGAVSALTRDELEYLIGHELGHIRCEHMLHLFMAQVLPHVAKIVPVVGPWLSFGISAALGEWQRKAELSCDRMGLLTCQDPEAGVRVMMKWSGAPGAYYQRLDQAAFLRQNEEFRDLDRDVLSMVYKLLLTLGRSHPWTVERAAELMRWHAEGGYEAIFNEPVPAGAALLAAGADEVAARRPSEVEADAADPLAARVMARLGRIAQAADSLGAGGTAAALVEALAAREAQPAPEVVVVGEKNRGKTTVAQRLGEACGPGVAIVDTPGLNDADAGFEEGVMAAVLRADVVLVCLSAAQLLSAEERLTLRERILPLAPGKAALVITHMDALENDGDRAELASRLARFVARSARADPAVFHLAPGADAALPEALVTFVQAAGQAARAEDTTAWQARVNAVLDALERTADALPEDAGDWRPPGPDEREAVRAAIAREHGLALTAAAAHTSGRIASLRLGVPARVASLTPQSLAREGLAGFTGEVQRVAREAAGVYLAAFERGLASRAGLADHTAARLRPEAGDGLGDGPGGLSGVRIDARRPRDVVTIGLTVVGAGFALFGGGVAGLLVGGVAIAAAHGLRIQADENFRGRLREDATAAIDGWLAGAEQEIVTRLQAGAEPVRDALLARAEAVLDRPPPLADGEASIAGLREAIAACRGLLGGPNTPSP